MIKVYDYRPTKDKSYMISYKSEEVGVLQYKNYFSSKAEFILHDHSRYFVSPKSFWSNTIEVKKEDAVVLDIKMNWKGQLGIVMHHRGRDLNLILKHQGFFKKGFTLLDQDHHEVALIHNNSTWNPQSSTGTIQTLKPFDEVHSGPVLLLAILYGVQHYYKQMSAVG